MVIHVCGLFTLILPLYFLLYLPSLFLFLNYMKSMVNLHNSCNEGVDASDDLLLSTEQEVLAVLSARVTELPMTAVEEKHDQRQLRLGHWRSKEFSNAWFGRRQPTLRRRVVRNVNSMANQTCHGDVVRIPSSKCL